MLLLLLLFLLTVALCVGCALALHRLTGGSVGRTVFRAGWPLAVSVCQLPFLARSFAPAVLKPLAGLLPAMALVLCAAQACFVLQRRIKRHPAFLPAAGLALLCLFLECFPFQINFWASRSYAPTELLAQPVSITADSQTLTLHFSPLTAHNLYITYTGSPEQSVCAQVTYRESAFPGRDFTLGDTWQLYAQNENSRCLNLHLDGELTALQLEFAAGCEITVTGIQVNRPRPFDFSPVRVLCMLVLAGLFWFLRPGSSAWTTAYLERTRAQKWVCRGVCGGIALLFFFLAVSIPQLCHFRIPGYNTADDAGFSWADQAGGNATDQYPLLVKSLLHGQLYLEQEPDPALSELDSPYAFWERSEQSIGYRWDTAYYNGHYYVYFGIVPVLLFYLPHYLVTGQELCSAAVCLVCSWLFLSGCVFLLRALLRRWFSQTSVAAYLIALCALALVSGMPTLVGRPDIYEVPISCALALTVWGTGAWFIACRPCAHRRLWLLLGSICLALTAGCRPYMVLFAAIALPLFFREYLGERKLFTHRGLGDFVCVFSPFAAVAAALMAYNALRFGSPFDFGAAYNLTSLDMTRRRWITSRIPYAVWRYLLASSRYTAVFPFLSETVRTSMHGYSVAIAFYGGLFPCRPILLLGFGLLFVRRELSRKKLVGLPICWLAASLLMLCISVQVADIFMRYASDFLIGLVWVALLGLWQLEESMNSSAGVSNALKSVFHALSAVFLLGSLINVLLFVINGETNLQAANPDLFFHLQQWMMFWR